MKRWPELPLDKWHDTYATLHMWTQIVGKIVLATTPLENHFWNVTLRIGPRGLRTPLLHVDGKAFAITFNFLERQLEIVCSDGGMAIVRLEPKTVAQFYEQVMGALDKLSIRVKIWTMPVEIPDPIPFETDTAHHAYDPERAEAFWRVLLAIGPIFEQFRCEFIGKSSPVHFFWGSFDLAVTRFSGRRGPDRPDADPITREAYSHEVISHGFWPGSGPVQEPAFYAYAAPEPEGLKAALIEPAAAYYHHDLNEFMLPYEAVRTAADPKSALRSFLESTYLQAASLAHWNRGELDRSSHPQPDR